MYNYVQDCWQKEIDSLIQARKTVSQQEMLELDRKIKWMEETEMAVIISQEQNEIQTFNKWKLDIKTHRAKMEKRELDKEFKDKDNPLRVVFVCAMWLTGFDVKCLSCLYLDKPLKAHTLMQTIARANRVSEGKSNGLIIDYIGIVKALREALANYTGKGGGGGTGKPEPPAINNEEFIAHLLETIEAAKEFLKSRDFDLEDLICARDFAKLSMLKTAANAVSDSRESIKQYMTYGNEIKTMMKYIDRKGISRDDRERKDAVIAICDELKKKRKHVDTVDLMVQINDILCEYIHTEQLTKDDDFSRRFDISRIDFDLLRREFAKVKTKNLVIKDLEELIRARLDGMLKENPNRVNYYERYQKIIEAYNQEQDRATIEKTFMDLMDLANSMKQEEQRYVREGFTSDEELSLYDMLFNDELSKEDIKVIKKVAVDLLSKIKAKIAELDHWTDKQETKAEIDNLIRDTLWMELPESYDEIRISEYRQKIYEYVYMRYREVA
jgi:type I restriction enzyme R subunit